MNATKLARAMEAFLKKKTSNSAFFLEGLFPALRRAISACTASKVLRSTMPS